MASKGVKSSRAFAVKNWREKTTKIYEHHGLMPYHVNLNAFQRVMDVFPGPFLGFFCFEKVEAKNVSKMGNDITSSFHVLRRPSVSNPWLDVMQWVPEISAQNFDKKAIN